MKASVKKKEFAVLLRESTKLEKRAESQITTHEIIIKFDRAREELILELLKEQSFGGFKIFRKNKKDCFAYCQFSGDVQELDKQLKILKSKALLSYGEQEEKGTILEFFIDFDKFLPISAVLSKSKERRKRLALHVSILIVVFLMAIVVLRYSIIKRSLIFSVPTSKIAQPVAAHPSWNMFILPRYQAGWIRVKKEFTLDEKTMRGLFKKIKSTGYQGYGQILNDLTEYPEIILRALQLIVLSNVKDFTQLQKLTTDLNEKFLRSLPFFDQSKNPIGHKQFENLVIITFYKHISKDPSFVSFLVNKTWNVQG